MLRSALLQAPSCQALPVRRLDGRRQVVVLGVSGDFTPEQQAAGLQRQLAASAKRAETPGISAPHR